MDNNQSKGSAGQGMSAPDDIELRRFDNGILRKTQLSMEAVGLLIKVLWKGSGIDEDGNAFVVHRVKKHISNFTEFDPRMLDDKQLSDGSRGMIAFLLSHRPGEIIPIDQLMCRFDVSRIEIVYELVELENRRYARWVNPRSMAIFDYPDAVECKNFVQTD